MRDQLPKRTRLLARNRRVIISLVPRSLWSPLLSGDPDRPLLQLSVAMTMVVLQEIHQVL